MSDTSSANDLFAVTYTGSAALLDAVENILRGLGLPLEREKGGTRIHTLMHLSMGANLRRTIREVSQHHPADVLQLNWCVVSDLDEPPEVAYVRAGNFICPQARDISIAWSGPWPEMGARNAVNAALEDLFIQLSAIPGMENALVVLQAGESQVRAAAQGSAAGIRPKPEEATAVMRNEYFMKLLAQRGAAK